MTALQTCLRLRVTHGPSHRLTRSRWGVALALAVATAWPAGAGAHDTWFAATPLHRAGHWQLALGTGNQFPRQEFPITPQALAQQGCRHGAEAPVPTQPRVTRPGAAPTALALLVRTAGGARRGQSGAVTCWAELHPLDITIAPDRVRVYLDEIAASPALRDTWRDMQRRGLPWVERYSKHARIELLDRRLGGGDAPAARPVPMDLDIVLERNLEPVRAGDVIRFQVLRDGAPLADQPIELRGDRTTLGLWVRTDADGRAAVRVPFSGQWVLRGTDLRLSTERPGTWDSRFITLAFEALPRVD
jgi:hypothetical protein